MANTAVDDLFGRWNKRTATLNSQGVSPTTYKPIFQQDYQNVLKGGTPLSDQEAQIQFRRAYTGESVVGDPKPRTGKSGWFGLKNIPSDIRTIAGGLTKLPQFLAREAKDTAVAGAHMAGPAGGLLSGPIGEALGTDFFSDPKKGNALAQAMGYKDVAEMREKEPELQGDVSSGDIFRLATRAPFIRLVPGAYTAGNLTSEEGRTTLQETPVQAALDVLPVVSKVGRVAAAGKVADPALASTIRSGGRPARSAATEAFGTGTPMEALASGRPIRALSRITPTGRTSLGDPVTLSDRLSSTAERIGISADQRALARQSTIHNRAVSEVIQSSAKRYQSELSDLGFTSEDDLARLQERYATRTNMDVLDPPTQSAFDLFDTEMNRLVDDPDSALFRDTAGEVRSTANKAEKPIADLVKRKQKLEERIAKHEDLLSIEYGSPSKYTEPRLTKKGNPSKRMKGESMPEFLMRTSERARAFREDKLNKALEQHADLLSGADDVSSSIPPARFIPAITENIRTRLKQWAYTNLSPEQADQIAKDIDNKLDPKHADYLMDEEGKPTIDLGADGIPKKEISKIIREEYKTWSDLKAEGLDPGYLPGVTRGRAASLSNPSIILDRDYIASIEKGRRALGAATADDALTSLVAGAAEQAKKAHTHQFIQWMHSQHYLLPVNELMSKLRDETRAFIENNPGLDARAFEETILKEGYEKFDPKGFGLTYATPGGDFYMPKSLARTLRDLGYREPGAVAKASNAVQGTFKRAVLFQPSFLFNNAVGNLMFALMEADSPVTAAQDAYRSFKEVWGARRGGQYQSIPHELKQGVGSIDMTIPQQFQFGTGSKIGQKFRESLVGRGALTLERKWFGTNAALDDFYRGWAYLQDFRKHGDIDKAVQYARQVYSDMDELTPIERNYVKQVIPFYSFQRHLFKFASRYPVDHPIRTSVIATAIRQHEEEGDLPGRFKSMFWLGEPDESGEQWRVNLRSLNPFSDFGNNFTLGGFLSNSTPLIKAPVEALGISDITGAPGYTKRGYNAESGRYEAGRDFTPRQFLGNFIPFLEKGADFIDPDEGRYIPTRENNLLRGATSIFNVPLIPRITNVDRERYMQEKARVRDVSNAVQDVQAGRSDAQLRRYEGVVPFRGQLVPTEYVAELLALYKKQLREQGYTGAPSAVTPRK